MPRIPRCISPGEVVHVISRFVDRDWLMTTDAERERYLSLFGRAVLKTDWCCLGYCLMSNHIHTTLVAGAMSLSSWARRANSAFACWLNTQRGGLGPVFADRPSAYRVPEHRVGFVLAYVHNNPVRAGVVARARDSTWSSHRAYVDLEDPPRWLDVREGLARARCSDGAAFEALVSGARLVDLAPDTAAARALVLRLGGLEVGTPRISKPIELPLVARPFAFVHPDVPTLIQAACRLLDVPEASARRHHVQGPASRLKRVTFHAAAALGIPTSDVAAAFAISRQRGSQIVSSVLTDSDREISNALVGLFAKP